MTTPGRDASQAEQEGSLNVLIAGGGVGALEAMLALRELAGDRVSTQLMAPDPAFHYRPLSVTEPFGLATPRELDLARAAVDCGASFVQDALAEVEMANRRVRTATGRLLAYDALVIAIGTRGIDGVPGGFTFRDSADEGGFRNLLSELDRGEVHRIAFAHPGKASWPLGLYELALMTAARVHQKNLPDVTLTLVSPEGWPMEVFGRKAGEVLSKLLTEAGIELRMGERPLSFTDGELAIDGGQALTCDRVVSLPVPTVNPIPGLPQQPDGFVPVDRYGTILGFEREFAVGDVTWFPIKQGGLAAQLADCAASVIAGLAGAAVDPQPFQPVLRGALLTEWGPRFMRSTVGEPSGSTAASAALWWPPAKVAGKYLASFLADHAGYPRQSGPLQDLEASELADPASTSTDHDDVVRMALDSADSSADDHEYGRALRWLEVAEDLEMYLPREYELKRENWRHLGG